MAADPNYYKEVTPLQDETGTEPTQPVPAYGSACLRHTPQKLMRASSVTLSSETGVDRYGVCAPCQEDGRMWELKFRPSGISEIPHRRADGSTGDDQQGAVRSGDLQRRVAMTSSGTLLRAKRLRWAGQRRLSGFSGKEVLETDRERERESGRLTKRGCGRHCCRQGGLVSAFLKRG